ncbi:MAG: hypothetical protein HQM16_12860 [Deltaproteobacteria bacterium]|nr:hypothetical protein [Deltaproteobacteria bacterium]
MNLNLNQRLVAIGMRLSGVDLILRKGDKINTDIEKTILEAVLTINDDSSIASLLFSWIKVHGNYVITEKLSKLTRGYHEDKYPQIVWVHAIAAYAYENGMHKWNPLIKKYKQPQYLYPKKISESAIQLKGAIPYLKKNGFFVPEGSIRIREEDVLTPEELIKKNLQYKNRYIFGVSWRADIITMIQSGIKTPTEIAKLLGCSYEPAHRVFREYRMGNAQTACMG